MSAAADRIAEITARDYHADEVSERPSLSSSIANILCTASPAHAWAAHPRLNPDWQREDDRKFDLGTTAHAMLLHPHDVVHQVVDAKDWKTKAAQEQAAEIRLAGMIPLLPVQADRAQQMVDAVQRQLPQHQADPPLFADGAAERTLVWEEDGVVCRARLDWIRDDLRAIDDLKTTGRSARADQYERNLFSVGGDVQAAFYLRGLEKVTGRAVRTVEFRWVVVETSPPYALSVISPKPTLLELGNSKVEHALRLWRECMEKDEWPAYEPRVWWADAPAWELERWFATEGEDT